MSQDVNSCADTRRSCGPPNPAPRGLSREGTTVFLAQHSGRSMMPVFRESRREADCHWHIPHTTVLRRRDLPPPIGLPDAELLSCKVDLSPFQCHHLAAAKPCFTSQQDD